MLKEYLALADALAIRDNIHVKFGGERDDGSNAKERTTSFLQV